MHNNLKINIYELIWNLSFINKVNQTNTRKHVHKASHAVKYARFRSVIQYRSRNKNYARRSSINDSLSADALKSVHSFNHFSSSFAMISSTDNKLWSVAFASAFQFIMLRRTSFDSRPVVAIHISSSFAMISFFVKSSIVFVSEAPSAVGSFATCFQAFVACDKAVHALTMIKNASSWIIFNSSSVTSTSSGFNQNLNQARYLWPLGWFACKRTTIVVFFSDIWMCKDKKCSDTPLQRTTEAVRCVWWINYAIHLIASLRSP